MDGAPRLETGVCWHALLERQQRGLSVCFRGGLTMQPAIRLPVAILFFALHSHMNGGASFLPEVCTFEKEATNDESVR